MKLARARLAARCRRTRRIRLGVVPFSVVLFLALFVTIYVQLASGHDPALSVSSKTARAAAPSRTSAISISSQRLLRSFHDALSPHDQPVLVGRLKCARGLSGSSRHEHKVGSASPPILTWSPDGPTARNQR
jgi:hypothetical protein